MFWGGRDDLVAKVGSEGKSFRIGSDISLYYSAVLVIWNEFSHRSLFVYSSPLEHEKYFSFLSYNPEYIGWHTYSKQPT